MLSTGPSTPSGSSPCSGAVGKGYAGSRVLGHAQGRCRGCRKWFIGPGDRCQDCARLVRVKAAKRRRKR
jgi:hypothetical protein